MAVNLYCTRSWLSTGVPEEAAAASVYMAGTVTACGLEPAVDIVVVVADVLLLAVACRMILDAAAADMAADMAVDMAVDMAAAAVVGKCAESADAGRE